METTQVNIGIFLGIIAGMFLGSFALPMKHMNRWNWEHIWLLYSVWALIILPLVLAYSTVPDLFTVYASVSYGTLATVFSFGALWGIACVGFGIGLKMLGFALGMAIILGLNNAIGAILPLILYHPDKLVQPVGIAVTGGVCVMLIGIGICAIAGAKKDKAQTDSEHRSAGRHSREFIKGLIVCLVAGIFGAMFNFALIEGKTIELEAIRLGATPLNAANPTWCVALLGGFVVTLLYCLFLMARNNSWNLYIKSGTSLYWLGTFIMGLLWFGGVALYGMAVSKLGTLGPSIGWPIIQSMAVASGNVWGIVSGEWKGSGTRPLQIMLLGLLVLFVGIGIIGWSSTIK